jgi:hypothetical protein
MGHDTPYDSDAQFECKRRAWQIGIVHFILANKSIEEAYLNDRLLCRALRRAIDEPINRRNESKVRKTSKVCGGLNQQTELARGS